MPQGSCTSLILVAYFTAPLGDSIKQGFESTIQQDPELSSALNPLRNSLAPLTLYVDDGSIAASAQDQITTSKMVEIAFREAHQWLTARGLKLNQVKNELIHFMRSRRGRHAGDRPSVTVPTNTPGEQKTVKPAKSIHYLGIWLDLQLNFNEHVQKTMSKALTATHALKIVGNSIRGMHQEHTRRIYIGAIHPIATYGLPIFWKSKNGKLQTTLATTQNKCLRMITGTFRTTNITAMEIEASIPPIDIWMDYRLEMEALRLASLSRDHPITCRIYPDQRTQPTPVSPPPLPPNNESKRYRSNPKNKFTTCITQVSKHILDETECITPNAKPPWRPSEVDLDDRVKIFIPANLAGELVKEEWVNAHMELMAEEEDNNDILFVYSDSSLSEKGGRRTSGYGVVGYCQGKKVFETNGAMGEHTEVFDTEMAGLHRAVTEVRNFIENQPPDNRPHKIAFYADNMGVIQR